MTQNANEQRPPAVEYQTPRRSRPPGRVAIFAFIFGIAFVTGLFVAPVHLVAGRIIFFTAAIAAIAGGVIGLRHAENHQGTDKVLPWTAIIIGAGIICFLLFLRAFDESYNRANRVKCQSNIRQIGQGLMLYAHDHQGQLPQGFQQLISDADVNPEVFNCPDTADQKAVGQGMPQILADFAKPGRCSYAYLGSGLSLTTVTKDFVLAYEPLENHEGGGAHFVFGDFHEEWRDAKEAKKIIEQLKSGLNPPKQ